MPRNEHDGQWRLARNEFFLEFQAAHARHAYVCNQYAHLVRLVRIEKLFRSAKAAYTVAICFEQPPQGIAYRFVVVDNEDGARGLWCSHACNSWVSSAVLGACGDAHGRVKRKMVPP